MGEIVKLATEDNGLAGQARDCLNEGMRAVATPVAVVIVTIGGDGSFACRTVSDHSAIKDFDMYSRAGSIMERMRARLLET